MGRAPIPGKLARNSLAYALGEARPNGFYIRKIIWGRTMAIAERRKGEEIRRATIWIDRSGEED